MGKKGAFGQKNPLKGASPFKKGLFGSYGLVLQGKAGLGLGCALNDPLAVNLVTTKNQGRV